MLHDLVFSHRFCYFLPSALILNYRQPLPHAARDKAPEEDDELKAPVEDDDAAAALKASQDMASSRSGGHKHRIALLGVEYLSLIHI